MNAVRDPFNLSRSGPWFAALLLVALVAFWPNYLSQVWGQTGYTHMHALTATLWILLLIIQPMMIRARRFDLHRRIARASFFIAPLVLLSVVLLAHSKLQGLEGQRYAIQTYILYLQVSLAALFTVSYAMALVKRRDMPVHARFMVCTALTLIDPVVVRLMLWVAPVPAWNYQWLTFALTDVIFLALIWFERHATRGRWVFPVMLFLFVLLQIPALFGLTESAPWQAFARWFASLNLT